MDYLSLFRETPALGMPDLIIMDINMPKISGMDLLKLIKADPASRNVSVVMLTNSAHGQDIQDSYAKRPMK